MSHDNGGSLALTGAVAATRYVGGTASVAPTTGSFLVGDFVITQDGKVFVCTVAGSPGTWAQVGGGGGAMATDALWDAAGDLAVGTGADTAARLAVGASLTTRLVNNAGTLAWLPHIVVLGSDQTVNNSTVLVDATGVSFAIGANEKWWVEAFLVMATLSGTSKVKYGWTGPASCTMLWGSAGVHSSNVAGWGASATGNSPLVLVAIGGTLVVGSVNGTHGVALSGLVTNSTNAGTIQLQFAQNAAVAENTVIKANSFLRLTRLA